MSDTEFTVHEKLRASQLATEQLLVAIISTLCDLQPRDDTIRRQIASRFENLVARFGLNDVTHPAKVDAVRDYMLEQGLQIIVQVLPRPLPQQKTD